MSNHRLRVLHISDLHMDAGEDWRRRRVLGDAWQKNLESLVADGRGINLICFTGDLAKTGKPQEFLKAAQFLLTTAEFLNVSPDRLFLVPGNHDVDQIVHQEVWAKVRRQITPDDAIPLSRWVAGGPPPRGMEESHLDAILDRTAAYRQCVADVLGRGALLPRGSPHGRLGFCVDVEDLGFPFPVSVVGLDSAWLSGDDHDAGKLWLTDDQIGKLTSERDATTPGFSLGLIHHPLAHLMDGSHARRLLGERLDILLRGHRHEEEVSSWADPDRTLRQFTVGCLYEHDRFPNACHLIDLVLDDVGRPTTCHIRFRGWTERGFWHDVDSLYRKSSSGWLTIHLEPIREPSGGLHPGVGELFIGREDELQALSDCLLGSDPDPPPVAIGAVQGMAGVGKSYLAARFAYLHLEDFPGGVVPLMLQLDDPRDAEALCLDLCDQLHLRVIPPHDHWSQLREYLQFPKTLLLVENVDNRRLSSAASELARRLQGCRIIVTGRYRGLGRGPGWRQIPVRPFDPEPALRQLIAEHRQPVDHTEEDEFRRLAEALGRLPLAIHLAAGYLQAGHTVDGFLRLLRSRDLHVGPWDESDPLTADRARSVLSTTFSLSLDTLRSALGPDADRLLDGLYALGHGPASGFGRSLGAAIAGLSRDDFETLMVHATSLSVLEREGPPVHKREVLSLHPLLAQIVRERTEPSEPLRRMTEWFLERLPEFSDAVDPGNHPWRSLMEETAALADWLRRLPPEEVRRVERAGHTFATRCGPYRAWAELCRRGLQGCRDSRHRSDFLWTLGIVTLRAGDPEEAMACAREKLELDRADTKDREAALAKGLIADILQDRGELDEALRIRQQEELPVYERLGDVRSLLVGRANLAMNLMRRTAPGDVTEARRLLRLALDDAIKMKLPEARQIEGILRSLEEPP